MERLDAIVIGNYAYTDKAMITTGGVVHNFKLYLDDYQCSFDFLRRYFKHGRDLEATKAEWDSIPRVAHSPTFLNAIYISDLLRKKLGFTVKTINNFADEIETVDRYLELRPRYGIISSSLIIFPGLISEITDYMKERVPGIKVIIGGTKIFKSYKIRQLYDRGELIDFPLEWLTKMHYFFGNRKDRSDYYVVNSRGETTLLELLRMIDRGDDPRGLPNLAYYDGDEFVMNEVTQEPYILEDFSIDWWSVDEDIIGFEIPVSIKQGCPYRCSFCDFVGLERKLVTRRWDLVLSELRAMSERFTGKSVCCVDENLFLNKDSLKSFCRNLIKAKLDIRWRGFTRTDVIDNETAELLRESGCYSMALGVESGDAEILKHMSKQVGPERALEAIYALNRVGINTYSTLFMGFPCETEETVQNTIDFLNSYPTNEPGLNFYSVNAFLVLPISPVSTPEMRKKYRLSGYYDKWKHLTMDSEEAVRHVIRLFKEVHNCYFVYLDSNENSLLDGSVPQHREIVKTRQQIVQGRINGMTNEEEARLWDRLDSLFATLEEDSRVRL